MPFLVPLVIAIVSASYTVNIVEIEDWPELAVTEHVTTQFPEVCAADAVGCAIVKLAERTCDVYLSPNWPAQQTLREHELEHCRGHDHMPFNLRAAHEAWVAAGKPYVPPAASPVSLGDQNL